MLGLNETKYATVCLTAKKLLPWIVPVDSQDEIRLNAGFIQNMIKHHSASKGHTCRAKVMSLYSDEYTAAPTLNESLKLLGLTIHNGTLPFISQEQFTATKQSALVIALTEKYLFPITSDSTGAGRHALLKTAQLKSIGRNVLCTNEDYFHSWGGLAVQDALKGYLSAQFVDVRAKLPCLKIHGLFIYEEEILPGVLGVVALRDAKTFRLAQLFPHTLDEREIKTVKTHLKDFFKTEDPHEMLERIFENYIHAYSVGIRHEAISPDNLLVDGRWIDTESLNINSDKRPQDLWLQISFASPEKELLIEKFRSFEHYDNLDLVFRDSWIHRLSLMCAATHFVFDGLWDDLNFSSVDHFKRMITKYFPNIDHVLWFELLEKFDSELIYKFSMPRKKKSPSTKLTSHPALNLNGYYYDHLSHLHIMTFAAEAETSHEVMGKLVNKWARLFPPGQLNWDQAFKLADQIKMMSTL